MAQIHHIAVPLPDKSVLHARLFLPAGNGPFQVLVFCHGFKGFRGWGFFNRMHEVLGKHKIALITFNFTHNGVAEDTPTEFSRLDLFADNTISRELAELGSLIAWVHDHGAEFSLDTGYVSLAGHSRGAADAILFAATDKSIKNVIAWAPVSDLAAMFARVDKAEWQKQGKILIPNARTGQDMPLNYTFWEDLNANGERYDILEAAGSLECGLLIIHGTEDTSVPIQHAEAIYEECWHAVFMKIEGADHTFNARHPMAASDPLPPAVKELLTNSAEFLLN